MKKTLQKTLAVVMVIAMIFSQMAIMSFATAPTVVGFSVVSNETFIENYNGEYRFISEYDEEGNYISGEYFYYYTYDWDLYCTVEFSDGSKISGDRWEIGDNFYGIVISEQDWYNQWTVGTNTVTATLKLDDSGDYNIKCEFEVEVIENPVTSISAVATKKLIEDYHGYYTSDWIYDDELGEYVYSDEYFKYSPGYADLKYTVVYNGETYIGYDYEIYEITGLYPDDDWGATVNQSYKNQWKVGTHEFTVSLYGVEGIASVEVVENPVESIEVVPKKDLIENFDGCYTTDEYWDDNLQEYVETEEYYYYDVDAYFFEYTITYKDGSVYTGDCWDIQEATGYYPSINFDQSYENQWGVGTHSVEITFLGNTITATVNVIECPVKSITVTQGNDLVEGINGDYRTDSIYDENDEYIGESDSYFHYYIDEADLEFTVTYKDGTVYQGTEYEIFEKTGESIYYDSVQNYDNQWIVGNNEITVSFLGFETTAQVKVIESPLDYIEVNDVTIIYNADGYWDYDYYYDEELDEWVETNKYFHYDFYPSYTAVMKDGTRYESDSYGDILYNDRWISMSYTTDQSFENPWVLGEHEVTGAFMGQEVSFKVNIVETPIKNMTFTPVRDLILGVDDYEEYYAMNDYNVIIEFKDGTVDNCLASDLYRKYGYGCGVYDVEFVSDYVSVGTVDFMGYEGEFRVNFIDNPYKSITISGTNELVISFNKYDGTKDVATVIDCEWFIGGMGVVEGVLFTDKGVYPVSYYYAYDEAKEEVYPYKDVKIQIGDMVSNTLSENNWVYALQTFKNVVGDAGSYRSLCKSHYGREFTGLDITASNYNVTDLANIAAYHLRYEYEYEYEYIDNLPYFIFNADDVAEMIETVFNITNVDVTKHVGYNSDNNTIYVPTFDGYGDGYETDINYSFAYNNGKWYGTIEVYTYYSGETDYINLVLSDDILVERITFGNQNFNGWVNENGKWAFYENGIKLKNQWKADSKGWCYLGEDGYMLTNALVKDSQGVCFVGSDGYIVYNKWVQFEGKWYFIDTKGYTVTNQWRKDSSGWCYLGSDGAMLTNEWVKDSKGYCYVSATGYIVYNQWVNYDGKWYFVDANGYKVSSQWRKDSIGWCYLGSDGAMLTNEWVKDSKGYCYVGSNGYIVYNKWVSYDGKWYFVDANGYKVSSQWRKDSIGWCYLGSDGAMLTNKWVKDSKGWCYVDESGYIVYNQWINDGGKSYYIDANGYMVSNKWLKDGDNWRYVGADGSCLTNQWMKDSVGWCFLDENGKMVTNAMVTDSHGVCFVGEDGYWQSNVIIDDGSGYLYFDETGYLATDVIVHDGYGYRYFDETGYMVTDTWLTIDGESVYVDSNGYLAIQ